MSFPRRSRLQMFFKIDVPKNFANFTGKYRCWSLFYKVAGLRFVPPTQTFSREICEIFKTPIFAEHFRRLLLIFREICKFLERCFLWIPTSETTSNIPWKFLMKMCCYDLLTCCLLIMFCQRNSYDGIFFY